MKHLDHSFNFFLNLVSTIHCFSTTALNNDQNPNDKAAVNDATDLGKDEELLRPANEGPSGSLADSRTSDSKNEAAEQLPVPQAASVSKTA